MMPDVPTMLVTALKLFLALSALGCAAILCWLAWMTRRIMIEDARDWQAARLAAHATQDGASEPNEPVPGETLVELDDNGAVFTAAEVEALDKRRRHWLMVPVETR